LVPAVVPVLVTLSPLNDFAPCLRRAIGPAPGVPQVRP